MSTSSCVSYKNRSDSDDWLSDARKKMLRVDSSKNCPCCGNDRLAMYTSLFLKACHHCEGNNGETVWLYWPLNETQKPLIKHQRG